MTAPWQPKSLDEMFAPDYKRIKENALPFVIKCVFPFILQLISGFTYMDQRICIQQGLVFRILSPDHSSGFLVSPPRPPPSPSSPYPFFFPCRQRFLAGLSTPTGPPRDSPWRMALRVTPIWFSPFYKFIAGILKMKLEGRLLETVFPEHVP